MKKARTTSAESMTGGMAIVRQLIANGVDTVFGLPGAQLYPFFDALAQNSEAIRTFGARHEQTCGYMAFGYARSTGRPGVFSVVPGPGVLNTGAALCTAAGSSTPVLLVTGQVPSMFLGKRRGHLHEIPDQLATLRSFIKWAARIERPEDAPAVVNEAFRQMLSGRPGPVAIEMCWDKMAQSAPVTLLTKAEIPTAPPPDAAAIDAAATLLAASKRPMIFTGTGAQHAAREVKALAEYLDAPVVAFRGGRGVVSEASPLGAMAYAGFRMWADTDVAVGIGTRMELPFMRWKSMMALIDAPEAPPHVVRIDIDPEEMTRLSVHAPVVADAADGARALLDAIKRLRAPASPKERKAARGRIATAKAEARAAYEKVQPQLAYLDVIRAALPDDGYLVPEVSQVGFTTYFGFELRKPRTYVSEGYQGTLGFGFPTALGAKAAHPGKPVISVVGDGGFMFSAQELATAMQYDIGLITILFNNNAFGNVLRDQKLGFGNRIIGATLSNPDFRLFAKSFGVEYHAVRTPAALKKVLEKVIGTKTPVLVEVVTPQGSETSPWEFIHPTSRYL